MDGDTVKTIDPLFEATMIGINVLDMNCPLDSYACAQNDGVVRNMSILRKVVVGWISIADEQDIRCKNRLQCACQLGFGHLPMSGHPIQGLPVTITCHQNAHLFIG